MPTISGDTFRRASLLVLGVALLALSVTNVFVSEADLWLRLAESGLPIGLSLIFLAFGVLLWERGTRPTSMTVIAGWAFAGGVVTGALAVWLLAIVALQDESISDPIYVVASSSTVGATFGGAAGFYHAQLQETTSELRRQNVRLDEFASIVSHDLRNPLGVAMGGLGLARETGDDEDFERVEQAHERMDGMINELLTLARGGRDVTDLERVSLERVATRARATVAADLDVTILDDRRLHADPERLAALFENLFRNSMEHGSTSGRTETDDASEYAGSVPHVEVGLLEDGFYVADDGPGIPPDERQQVFEHGYTTATSGTGIGLAIVRRIADAHGWRVEVTESEAGGARFEVHV